MKKLVLIVGLFYSFTAIAHEKKDVLGKSASATDIFKISCDANTDKVYFELFSSLPKGSPSNLVVSAELLGGKDTITVSSVNQSKSRSVNVQAKTLTILVNKNMAGIANFEMQYHCEAASGDHTATEINRPQNQ